MRTKIFKIDPCRPLGAAFGGNRAVSFDKMEGKNTDFRRTRPVSAVSRQGDNIGANRVDHVVDLAAHNSEPRLVLEIVQRDAAVLAYAGYVAGVSRLNSGVSRLTCRGARAQ